MSRYETKDSGQRQDYASGMRRDTQAGKPRFDLMEPDFVPYSDQLMTRVAELLERGAVKYGESNWTLANSTEELDRFRGSALRHLKQWYHGETDEDHAAATVFNLLAYESIKYKLGFLEGWEDVGYLTDEGIDKTQPFAGADLVDYKAAIDEINGSMFEAYQKSPVRRGCDVKPYVFVPTDDATPPIVDWSQADYVKDFEVADDSTLSIVDWSLPGYVTDFDIADLTNDLSSMDRSWAIDIQDVSQGFFDLLFGRPLQPPTDTPIYTQLALDFDLDSVGAST